MIPCLSPARTLPIAVLVHPLQGPAIHPRGEDPQSTEPAAPHDERDGRHHGEPEVAQQGGAAGDA